MSIPTKGQGAPQEDRGLRILVVGDVMLDHYIWGDATRISPRRRSP
jgi:bifunctional ADP-heptose synthase (sugar kinase/adenylyltransferase)